MSHETPTSKRCLLEKPWQRPTMIQVKAEALAQKPRDEDFLNLFDY